MIAAEEKPIDPRDKYRALEQMTIYGHVYRCVAYNRVHPIIGKGIIADCDECHREKLGPEPCEACDDERRFPMLEPKPEHTCGRVTP